MKKLIIPALTSISLLFITGCPGLAIDGRPPEYSVSNPSMVPDGAGGIIVVYQVNKGNTGSTYLQRLGKNGETLFGEKGIELKSGPQGFPCSGEKECVLILDEGNRNFVTVYNLKDGLWTQKLDMEGNSVWPEGKKKVSDTIPPPGRFRAVSDNSGSTIIVWSGWQENINLQRIDKKGRLQWNTSITAEVDKFDIACDASGSTFVIWKDSPSYSEGDIFVQKIEADGQITWPAGGLLLTDEANPGYVGGSFDHRIVSDGDGGVLCTWLQAILSEDGRKITGFNPYVQRINGKGEMLWGPGGVLITGITGVQEPRIVVNNSDSVLVFWDDKHAVYAQKIDILGKISWPGAGLEIAQAGSIVYYSVTGDGADGAVIVWNCSEDGYIFLRAQRLDSEGSSLWGDNGIKVSTVSPYWAKYSVPARISRDGTGGYVIAWASGNNIMDRTSSYIQRISPEGKLLWGEDGIKLGQ